MYWRLLCLARLRVFYIWNQSNGPVRELILSSPIIRLPSGKDSTCQCRKLRKRRRHRFNPWVRTIPWRRKWKPTPVFLPGKSHGQRSLVSYNLWGHKELDTTERLSSHALPLSDGRRGQELNRSGNDHAMPCSGSISQLISPRCPLPVWLSFIAPAVLEGRNYVCFISSQHLHHWWQVMDSEWVSEWMGIFIFKDQKPILISCPFDF